MIKNKTQMKWSSFEFIRNISFMLCYVSSENACSQEKMLLPKCRLRHFVQPAFSLAFGVLSIGLYLAVINNMIDNK